MPVVSGGMRARVRPGSFEVMALPIFELPPMLSHGDAPDAIDEGDGDALSWWRVGEHDARLFVWTQSRLTHVDLNDGLNTTRQAGHELDITCSGALGSSIVPLRFETLELGDSPRYGAIDSWVDVGRCQIMQARQSLVDLTPILGNVMFAFRSRCEHYRGDCTVTVVAPRLRSEQRDALGGAITHDSGRFSLIRMPVLRGGAASIAAMLDSRALASFYAATTLRPPASRALIGVEITLGVHDAIPTAIAHLTYLD